MSQPTKEKNRENNKRIYYEKKKQGLCVTGGCKNKTNNARCDECLAFRRFKRSA